MKLKITIALFLFIGLIQVAKADFFGKNPRWLYVESGLTGATNCKFSEWTVTYSGKFVTYTQLNCRCVDYSSDMHGKLVTSAEYEGKHKQSLTVDSTNKNKIYYGNASNHFLLYDFNYKSGDTATTIVSGKIAHYTVIETKDTFFVGQHLRYQKVVFTDSIVKALKATRKNYKDTFEVFEKLGVMWGNKVFEFRFPVILSLSIADGGPGVYSQYCDDDSLKYPNQHASAAQCLTFSTEIETPEQLAKKVTVKYFPQNHSIYFGDLSENKYTIQLFDLNGRKIPFTYESNNIINIDPNIHNSLILCQISYKGSPITTKKIIVN
jgi:hypothetical protein